MELYAIFIILAVLALVIGAIEVFGGDGMP